MTIISESDFLNVWKPIESPDGSDCWNEKPTGYRTSQVWTIVDSDCSGSLYASAGWRLVNRVGWCVTEKPWVTGEEVAEYDVRDPEDEDEWDDDEPEPVNEDVPEPDPVNEAAVTATLTHLRDDHDVDTVELGEWLLDYVTRHPDMAPFDHVQHLHDVIHDGGDHPSADHPDSLHDPIRNAQSGPS